MMSISLWEGDVTEGDRGSRRAGPSGTPSVSFAATSLQREVNMEPHRPFLIPLHHPLTEERQ